MRETVSFSSSDSESETSDSESEIREEKGLGVANREMREGSGVQLGGGDRVGCGPSTLVREGGFSPRTLGATQVASPALTVSSLGAVSLELALVGLGWEGQGKHTRGEGKRKGRRTGGPTLGLPPVPTGVVAAFIAAVYLGSDAITRQPGPSCEILNPCT